MGPAHNKIALLLHEMSLLVWYIPHFDFLTDYWSKFFHITDIKNHNNIDIIKGVPFAIYLIRHRNVILWLLWQVYTTTTLWAKKNGEKRTNDTIHNKMSKLLFYKVLMKCVFSSGDLKKSLSLLKKRLTEACCAFMKIFLWQTILVITNINQRFCWDIFLLCVCFLNSFPDIFIWSCL